MLDDRPTWDTDRIQRNEVAVTCFPCPDTHMGIQVGLTPPSAYLNLQLVDDNGHTFTTTHLKVIVARSNRWKHQGSVAFGHTNKRQLSSPQQRPPSTMSRRPAAGPDRSEQNRATLKQLVKLEGNKSCGDCKRNKHPRWASWNLGVFVCIRCSGIHRSLGVHISKVKSVDLDTWTDEQMQNMLRWGNTRANKYWEHKLAEGHVPNEAKIENFIRTKYDSKRWVMDGPMPDPSTLDDGEPDDDVPLNVVQEKVKQREQGASIRNGSAAGGIAGPPGARPQPVDFFGDDSGPTVSQPARPSTTEPSFSRPGPPKAPAAQPKATRPGESLLGLDFFGGTQSAQPARPSSTGPNTPGAGNGRSDLKQSILSLYASKPAAPAPQPTANAFGGMQAASPTSPQSNTQSLSGLGDAFGSLSMAPSTTQSKPAPFSNFSPPAGHFKQPSIQKSSLSGGSFFDMKPAAAPAPPPKPTSPPSYVSHKASNSFGNDFGDFSSASPAASTKSPPLASSSMGDLFDMAAPAPPPKPAPINSAGFSTPASNYSSSAFNLSQPAITSVAKPAAVQSSNFSSMNNMDAWGSSDAWATPDPSPAPAPAKAAPPPPASISASAYKSSPAAPAPVMNDFDSGWGDPAPAPPAKPTVTTPGASGGGWGESGAPSTSANTSGAGFSVQQDEEFGGWSHASPVATTPGPKQGGMGGGSDDLFGNVWG